MIDIHTHPMLVREMIEGNEELRKASREVFHIGNNLMPLEIFHAQMDVAGIQKAVLLPIDTTTSRGIKMFSNEQIRELCQMSDRFLGFASVDPHSDNAVGNLRTAINTLGLIGLKLSPSSQEFMPNDKTMLYPIYEEVQALKIPVIMHMGMSWEPHAKAKYSLPLYMEDVAEDFPGVNFIIAHFGWPWVLESVMLALKYPNIYIDTSCLYFDSPVEFVKFVMTHQIPVTVIERSLREKIVFGSNYPRVEIKNMVHAIQSIGLSDDCLELIFNTNARRLLGISNKGS